MIMANNYTDTSLFDKAAIFAIRAHGNTERREKGTPYVIHCMEAASVVQTMTRDQELLAAAVLHDVVEDTDVTEEQLRLEFGDRITDLVMFDSEEPGMTDRPWTERKIAAMKKLSEAPLDAKMVAMGDKLSNIRAIAMDYEAMGDRLWSRFHVTEKKLHEWHYRELAKALSVLDKEPAYKEFTALVDRVFGPNPEKEPQK